jgi:SAM-dependent methyltransferase
MNSAMPPDTMTAAKTAVRAFWEDAACGERLYLDAAALDAFAAQARARYELEPYIADFAEFERWRGKRVLEIGVGLGADHERFARAGAELWGIDLTERAVALTEARFRQLGLRSHLQVGDAENLPFADGFFDLVYSWGVIHHTPDTAQAAREILRVLKPGGAFRVMIYHKHSIVGWMLWARYGLGRLRPWTSLDAIYARYLESPGTKAFSRAEARALFPGAADLEIRTELSEGDLLTGGAGQRHQGPLLSLAQRLWPRKMIRACFPGQGLFLLIQGRKGAQ